MMRQYRLGQFFRKRYNDLLGNKYSYKNVYIHSSDYDRTIMSAQANLAGLYAPTDDEKWHDDILWQPIPVHTLPRKLDNIIAIESDPSLSDIVTEHIKEKGDVKRIFTEHADLIAYWSKMSGLEIKKSLQIYWIYNTLVVAKEQNKKFVYSMKIRIS